MAPVPRTGRWHDYLFGERVYVWLSLSAKSVLAWQIFANTLKKKKKKKKKKG